MQQQLSLIVHILASVYHYTKEFLPFGSGGPHKDHSAAVNRMNQAKSGNKQP
jgi:hypothetical protein